jgi:hypothetical protein
VRVERGDRALRASEAMTAPRSANRIESPLVDALVRYVLSGTHLHADDTPYPVLALPWNLAPQLQSHVLLPDLKLRNRWERLYCG